MSKARDIRLHEELMEKLDTLTCQLHSLSNAAHKMQTAKPISWWEQQCREKDATLTETLRKLQAAEEEMLRQGQQIESLHARLNHSVELPAGMIFSRESRAALNRVVKDFIR